MSDEPRQLAFDLPVEPSYDRADFLVSPSNEAACALFDNWPDWPDRVLLLVGPAGAGKTHLGRSWVRKAGGCAVAANALARANLPALASAGAVLVEDADRAGDVENQFFHLINFAREHGVWLAITARSYPDQWGVGLPDLLSRLRRAPAVEIGLPDDALVRAVLLKLFIDRQLRIDTSVVEFLALRIERSLDAARAIVAELDREALERGRAVTRPMAAAVLKRLGQKA